MAGDVTLRIDASDFFAVLAEIKELRDGGMTAHQLWRLHRVADGEVRPFVMGATIAKDGECVLPIYASDALIELAHDIAVTRDGD